MLDSNLSLLNCSGSRGHDHANELYMTMLMYTVVAPVLLAMGIFGNFMVFVVIGHVCPDTTTSVHFRNLAIFDSLSALIITVLPMAHHGLGFSLRNMSRVSCAGLTFLRYLAGDLAIWLILVITVDRLFAVSRPLQVRRVCLPSTAKRIVIVLLILGLVKNGHLLFVRGLVPEKVDPCDPIVHLVPVYDCTTLKDHPTMYFFEKKIRPIIALVTVSVIPAFGVVICNAFITTIVCRNSKQWRETSRLEKGFVGSNSVQTDKTNGSPLLNNMQIEQQKSAERKRAKSERNSLILTLTNSTAFIVFVLPSFILCLLRHELPMEFIVSDSFREDMLLAITDILIVGNHTLNFYICYASSRSFRHKVRQYSLATCVRLGLRKQTPRAHHHHHLQHRHDHNQNHRKGAQNCAPVDV